MNDRQKFLSPASGPRFQREPFGLNQNRGILIASHGMWPKKLIMNNVFAQSDLQLSLLDLLGIDATGAVGRSVFRRYDEDSRFTAFANAYTDRFFLLEGTRLTTCTSNMECQSGVFPNGIFGPGKFRPEPLSEEAWQRARAMVLMNDAVGAAEMFEVIPPSLTSRPGRLGIRNPSNQPSTED